MAMAVAWALWVSTFKKRCMAGTATSPPPEPNIPLRKPAIIPISIFFTENNSFFLLVWLGFLKLTEIYVNNACVFADISL